MPELSDEDKQSIKYAGMTVCREHELRPSSLGPDFGLEETGVTCDHLLLDAVQRVVDRHVAAALREAADAAGPALQNEVGGHTSTYSVRRWLRRRADAPGRPAALTGVPRPPAELAEGELPAHGPWNEGDLAVVTTTSGLEYKAVYTLAPGIDWFWRSLPGEPVPDLMLEDEVSARPYKPKTWWAPLYREGVMSLDSRRLEDTDWSEPLPLLAAPDPPGEGHDGSRIVGFVTDVGRVSHGWVYGLLAPEDGFDPTGLACEADFDGVGDPVEEGGVAVIRGARLRAVTLGTTPCWDGMVIE